MRNYVCLRKLSRRTKPGPQLIEETQIQINLLIFWTVEGANRNLRHPTGRRIGVSEQHKLGVAIRHACILRQNRAPVSLHIIQDERDELYFRLLTRILLPVRFLLNCWGARIAREQGEQIAMEEQAE
jgi:hypothetical protein